MKKFCLLFLVFFSVVAQAATVRGKIEGKQLFSSVSVSMFSETGSFDFVTTRFINMDGTFQVDVEVLAKSYFQFNFTDGNKLNRQIFMVIGPNDEVKITFQSELAYLLMTKVEGSEEIAFIAQYQALSAQLMDQVQSFQQKYAAAATDAEKQALQHTFNQLYVQHLAQSADLLQKNSHYLASAFLAYSEFGQAMGQYRDLFQTLYKDLSGRYPHDALVKAIGEELQNPIQIGEVAPELEMKGWDGTVYKLSDYRGKYVLVDFWASWCRPCRMENPTVVKAYQTYHAKGLEIFSVSLDQSADKWKAAVAADGLTWPAHGSTLKGWSCPLAEKYHVSSIPFSVLLDPQGRIISISLRGDALLNKLAELMP